MVIARYRMYEYSLRIEQATASQLAESSLGSSGSRSSIGDCQIGGGWKNREEKDTNKVDIFIS